ncbi:RHS repeat protein [Gynuella sunshinyii]|uniref:Rhs family protein n=1 Tax=Gynuella sunshinyii YC6258 TaxID=1445510 RepID=A0A0C5VV96_9GAMM|nr:RHS repeat protein [Gynuella sunshinyii]AJQ94339.1 rhs family protein [Gynuella sunshinyii YC6258]
MIWKNYLSRLMIAISIIATSVSAQAVLILLYEDAGGSHYYWAEHTENWVDGEEACDRSLGENICIFFYGGIIDLASDDERVQALLSVPGVEPGMIWAWGGNYSFNDPPRSIYALMAFSISQYCPSPYKYNRTSKMCEAICKVGDTWNPTLKRCESEPAEHNSCTQSANPVDFVDGSKYRHESVMSVGTVFPIELTFHYNNFQNTEKTVLGGRRPLVASDDYAMKFTDTEDRIVDYYVADQIPLIGTSDSTDAKKYNNWGILKTEEAISEPYRGDVLRYWRHNYDEALVPRSDGVFTWLRSDGENIEFDTSGHNAIYPRLSLTTLDETIYGYSGHVLKISNGLQKTFDERGRLRRVTNANGVYHELTYNDDDQLTRITHSLGGYLDLTYTYYRTFSLYAPYTNGPTGRSHVTQVSDNAGRHVDIGWSESYSSDQHYYVITRLSQPYTTESTSSREFQYNDGRWPASLTDMYDVQDGTRSLYAHFEYDNRGRAVLSQLANAAEQVSIEYPDDDTRVITNALGKQATYRFATFNDVNRLASVTGEPTSQCLQSNTRFNYDDDGNVIEKNVNGVITQYQYDSRNLEVQRTEAAGTDQQRIITTTWDTTLRRPLSIHYPDQTITYNYDNAGRLLSQTVTPVE